MYAIGKPWNLFSLNSTHLNKSIHFVPAYCFENIWYIYKWCKLYFLLLKLAVFDFELWRLLPNKWRTIFTRWKQKLESLQQFVPFAMLQYRCQAAYICLYTYRLVVCNVVYSTRAFLIVLFNNKWYLAVGCCGVWLGIQI